MSEKIDCLFIGHNESDFNKYAESVYALGKNSPTYRDLKMNYIWHQGARKTVTDIYNMYSDKSLHFHMGDVFSTTIAYLGTYLNKHGFSFDYVNDFQYEKDALIDKLLHQDILAIGITTTLYTFDSPIIEVCKFIRKYNDKVVIIIGGPYILNLYHTSMDSKIIQNFLRASGATILVNSSQGEDTLAKVLTALKSGGSFEDVPNITYWKDGVPRSNDLVIEDNKLDDNVIDWNMFKKNLGTFVGVRTCISCPYNCYFCGFRERAGMHRLTSLDKVELEFDMLEKMGVKSVNFIDDTFNIPPKRFKEVLKLMIGKKYSFKWNCYFRCQYADEETIKLMEESNCEGVYLGIESANQHVLDSMRKSVNVGDYVNGIKLLKKSGILIHTNFIMGFVGETRETINDTVSFIRDYEPDFYRIQLWYLDRVTPIWRDRSLFNVKGSGFTWKHDTMSSEEASDYIDDIFINKITASTWVPVYNFNLHNLYRLKQKGMDIGKIKGFLNGFNLGIKENLKYPDTREVSEQTITAIKKHIQPLEK